MNYITEYFLKNLWNVSIQISILIGIIWLVSLMTKKASAEFRYLLWCIVIVRLCIPVGINLPFLPSFGNMNLINQQYPISITEPVIEEPEIVNKSQNSENTPSSLKVTPEINNFKPNKIDYRLIAFLFWLSGVASITIITIRRNIILHRKLKKCPQIEQNDLNNLLSNLCRQMRIKQDVLLYYMDTSVFSGPVASGLFRHKIFLPPVIADTWSIEEIEPILLHELAHIKRHDSIINFIQTIVQTIYFFHPLVWLVNSRINTIREEACDDMAIGYLEGETARYSISILNVIGFLKNEKNYGLAGFGFAEMKNSLSRRIVRIMNCNYGLNRKMSRISLAALVFIGIFSIAVAGAKNSESPEDILKVAENGDTIIRTGMGKLTDEYVLTDTTSTTQKKKINELKESNEKRTDRGYMDISLLHNNDIFYGFEGDQLRGDNASHLIGYFSGKYERTYSAAFDGKISEHLSFRSINNEISDPKASIVNFNSIYDEDYNPRYYGYYIFGVSVVNFLSENKEFVLSNQNKIQMEKPEYVKDEVIEKEKCVVYKSKDKNNKYLMTVWLGKNLLYRPVKIEINLASDSQISSSMNYTKLVLRNKYQKLNDRILFPEITEIKRYHTENNNEILLDKRTIKISHDFKVNVDIPDSVFRIQFPKGIDILDTRIPIEKLIEIDKNKQLKPSKSIIVEKPSQIIKIDSEILEYSEQVLLNGNKLIRDKDYLIDYNKREITFLNEKPFDPKADLRVNYQTK